MYIDAVDLYVLLAEMKCKKETLDHHVPFFFAERTKESCATTF